MKAKVFRCTPATGKPRKIVCTGCGKRAPEAGFAIDESDVRGWATIGIDGDDARPLCADCVIAAERENRRTSRFVQ